jgi:hypothetical protein
MEILVIVQLCLLFFEQEQNKYTNVGTVGTLKKKLTMGTLPSSMEADSIEKNLEALPVDIGYIHIYIYMYICIYI